MADIKTRDAVKGTIKTIDKAAITLHIEVILNYRQIIHDYHLCG